MTLFKTGDQLTCINAFGFEGSLTPGHTYIADCNQADGQIVVCGMDVWLSADRFVLKAPAQPSVASAPFGDIRRKALEYLQTSIKEYAETPPDGDYDAGYLDAQLDMLEEVFGVKAVTEVKFMPVTEG